MIDLINDMEEFFKTIKETDQFKKLIAFYNNKFYAFMVLKQFEQLLTNMKSINALLDLNNIEDAYTIFRKYLETYCILMSVYENTSVVNQYMIHDSYVGYKACGEKMDEIRNFIKDQPEGYLEYGYLENVVDTSQSGFKYTMKTVCKAAKLKDYYGWYKMCNNFVHNNLSSVVLNPIDGKTKLIEKCKKSFYHMKQKIEIIL